MVRGLPWFSPMTGFDELIAQINNAPAHSRDIISHGDLLETEPITEAALIGRKSETTLIDSFVVCLFFVRFCGRSVNEWDIGCFFLKKKSLSHVQGRTASQHATSGSECWCYFDRREGGLCGCGQRRDSGTGLS
jgi:hypothetical protein